MSAYLSGLGGDRQIITSVEIKFEGTTGFLFDPGVGNVTAGISRRPHLTPMILAEV